MLFDNPLGWYSFIAVGVLVISYLIKPKPLDIKIPSVRFLMHEKGTRQKSTFFQRFITNLLFLLQLLALGALAFATTLPIISMTYDSTGEHTVIVLDVSNSMNTEVSAGQTRLDKAKNIAENNLKGQVSIILAETVPLLVLEDESTSQAKSVLAQLTPKHTSTNIGDAMILAGDLLSAKGDNNKASGRILVISDFVWTDGADPEVMKQVLEARGMVVDFVNIGKAKENVGFVDFKIDTTETTVFLKNYGREKTVSLLLKNEMEGQKTITRTLLEEGIEPITFPTMGGITRLELKDDDALTDDNAVYLSNPKKTKIRILMMTNKPNKFMVNALTALGDTEVTVAEPPIVPDIDSGSEEGEGFDIIIYSEVDHKKILPGTMKEIKQAVEQGTPFIVTFQESLNQIDFDGLLAISPDIVHEGAGVKTVIQNQFTKDVDFGTTEKYYKAKA
ncbi:TPA: VWA domain-containing protein, partial [Candidatus Woesearchaeota archaeon]|nr:VWA domain-containing protein [Candidatus Woesearchaeota archaeon]